MAELLYVIGVTNPFTCLSNKQRDRPIVMFQMVSDLFYFFNLCLYFHKRHQCHSFFNCHIIPDATCPDEILPDFPHLRAATGFYKIPGACFSKAPKTFRAHKAIFSFIGIETQNCILLKLLVSRQRL